LYYCRYYKQYYGLKQWPGQNRISVHTDSNILLSVYLLKLIEFRKAMPAM